MPRDSGGIYSLPAGNPVTPGTIIESGWANPTMSDIGAALSDSLSRSGKGGMTAALRGPDGSAAVPTFSFTNEPASGRYRDGPGRIVESVDGVPVIRYSTAGLEQWNGATMDWEPLTPRDAAGTPFDPGPTSLTSTNVQDAIEEVYASVGGIPEAGQVSYDDTLVYFGAPTVQHAIDILGVDLAGVASDLATLEGEVTVLEGEVDIIDTTVNNLVIDVNQNEADIGVINTWIGEHEIDYGNLAQRVGDNELDIIEEKNRIQPVSLGGTGVTQSTGTGKTVLSSNAVLVGTDISNGNLTDTDALRGTFTAPEIVGPSGFIYNIPIDTCHLTSSTCTTQASSDNDTSIASTAFVQAAASVAIANAIENMTDVYWGQNANGWYLWFWHVETIVMWGSKAASGNVVINYPATFTVPPYLFIQQTIGGGSSPWSTSPVVTANQTSWAQVATDHHFYWYAWGRLDQ